MKSNAFEEVISPNPNSNIAIFHNKLLEDNWFLPNWIKKLDCPYCKKKLHRAAIRSISIKLNPRNIGDVCVEFLCKDCSVGNTLYFTKASKDMMSFINLLNPDSTEQSNPESKPILEEEMYKQKYHNTIEAMIQKKGNIK